MGPKYTIVVAEDQQIVREGLSYILKSMCDLELIFVAKNGQELLDWLSEADTYPDFALLDIDMPVKNGFDTCAEISRKYPSISSVFLTHHISKKFIETAVLSGATGYLSKDSSAATIKEATSDIKLNGYYFNKYWTLDLVHNLLKKGKIKHKFDLEIELTTREIEVLRAICLELTDAEIAEKLFLSQLTVESYRKSLLRKVGVKKAIGLAIFAIKNNIL
jgi:DNA-binding NarL/FixJ family response regulator